MRLYMYLFGEGYRILPPRINRLSTDIDILNMIYLNHMSYTPVYSPTSDGPPQVGLDFRI